MTTKRKIIMLICAILLCLFFIGLIFFQVYYTNNNVIAKKDNPLAIKKDNEKQENTVNEIEKLQIEYNNNDIISILEVPGLFESIVTKTKDNSYYLTHNISKEKNETGNVFMDYRNDVYSKQINIYGHNFKNSDLPFTKLENFYKQDFFEKNKYIYLKTNNDVYKYEIFSVKIVTTDYEHMNVDYTNDSFIKHVNHLKENSLYTRNVEFDENSDIIVLQTCSYLKKDAYLVICGIKIV